MKLESANRNNFYIVVCNIDHSDCIYRQYREEAETAVIALGTHGKETLKEIMSVTHIITDDIWNKQLIRFEHLKIFDTRKIQNRNYLSTDEDNIDYTKKKRR